MTKEELEKEAEDKAKQYMNEHTEKYNCENTKLETDNYNVGREYGYEDGYLAGAEPREKRIAELEKKLKDRCVDTDCPILSINNQNMRCVAKLEEKVANLEYLLEGRDNEIDELKEQIEKMKWHKVSDGDFPKVTGDYITNIGVLTYDHYGNNIYKWHTPFCEACDYGDVVDDDEVIAWCEIPKYTKEIKEKVGKDINVFTKGD